MKKVILLVLLSAVFFTGLGGMIQETTAKFKSDERALALLAKARQAIGGDSNLAGINSMVVKGKTTKIIQSSSTERLEGGEMELALQFPDKLTRMIKFGQHGAAGGTVNKFESQEINVVVNGNKGEVFETSGTGNKKFTIVTDDIKGGEAIVEGDKRITVFKKENGEIRDVQIVSANGGTADKKFVLSSAKGGINEQPRHNEMLRLSLSLFLTAPQGMDVAYTYAGSSNVDGAACEMIDASFGGSTVRLYLNQSSNLPVMVSYQGGIPTVFKFTKSGPAASDEKGAKVFSGDMRSVQTTTAGEVREIQVKYSDYRNVNGVLLPHTWTQTIGGQADESTTIDSYEINPANIADRFQNVGVKTFVRQQKEQ